MIQKFKSIFLSLVAATAYRTGHGSFAFIVVGKDVVLGVFVIVTLITQLHLLPKGKTQHILLL